MRLVERFSMIVFSIFVLLLACFIILVSIGLVGGDVVNNMIDILSENLIPTICVSILISIWSIVNIFWKSDAKNENINGILLENQNGSLLITKDSISNLVESVLKNTSDVKQENVKIDFNANRDLIISLIISVKDSTIIKDTSARLQENIKMTVKKATDLEIKEVNIKIKGVETEKKTQIMQ